MASRANPELQWQYTYQGKTSYSANCQRDVLIIVSSESLQGPDIVPRREVELTEEDNKELQRLNLAVEQLEDDTSIMTARYEMDKETYSSVTTKREQTKQSILKALETLMKTTTRAGVAIHYCGPGKRNTGDWCFEDGFITFREMADLYCKHFTGKLLVITTDCSYSGSWVRDCREFLDETGVQPCGHSARETGILMKVRASCKSHEIPHRFLSSIRSHKNDKNNGVLAIRGHGRKVAEGQHHSNIDSTKLECSVKSIDIACAHPPNYTWQRYQIGQRVYMVTVEDKGRPAWYYVLVEDNDETITDFEEKIAAKEKLDLTKYGKILKSAYGEAPPNEVRDRIEKQYKAAYD